MTGDTDSGWTVGDSGWTVVSAADSTSYVAQMASALQHLHRKHVIHRDRRQREHRHLRRGRARRDRGDLSPGAKDIVKGKPSLAPIFPTAPTRLQLLLLDADRRTPLAQVQQQPKDCLGPGHGERGASRSNGMIK